MRIEYISAELEPTKRHHDVNYVNAVDILELNTIIQGLNNEDTAKLISFNYKGSNKEEVKDTVNLPVGTKTENGMRKVHSMINRHTGLIA